MGSLWHVAHVSGLLRSELLTRPECVIAANPVTLEASAPPDGSAAAEADINQVE